MTEKRTCGDCRFYTALVKETFCLRLGVDYGAKAPACQTKFEPKEPASGDFGWAWTAIGQGKTVRHVSWPPGYALWRDEDTGHIWQVEGAKWRTVLEPILTPEEIYGQWELVE